LLVQWIDDWVCECVGCGDVSNGCSSIIKSCILNFNLVSIVVLFEESELFDEALFAAGVSDCVHGFERLMVPVVE
jgi:hypothetical protein